MIRFIRYFLFSLFAISASVDLPAQLLNNNILDSQRERAPVNTVAPAITGTAQPGQTFTSSTGTWSNCGACSYSYQWKRNGSSIGSATASTYLLTTTDDGNPITVTVTASNSAGSVSATSSATNVTYRVTLTGRRLKVIIGDSNARGNGATPGPDPGAGKVYEFDGTTEQTVRATDLIQPRSLGNLGSAWPKLGANLNTRTGEIPVFIDCSLGGTNFYPRTGESGNWYSSGTLRGLAITKVNAALAYYGLGMVDEIYVDLSTNDQRGDATIANIRTGIDDWVTWVSTNWPNTNVYMLNFARSEVGGSLDAKGVDIRRKIFDVAQNNTYFHAISRSSYFAWGYVSGDNIHFNLTGLNKNADLIDRYISYAGTYSTKWVRTVLSSFDTELSSGRRAKVKTFIEAQISASRWDLIDSYQKYRTDTQNNAIMDWRCLTSAFLSGSPTFTADVGFTTNGTSSYIRSGVIPDVIAGNFVRDNGHFGCRITTNSAAVSRTMMGSVVTGKQNLLFQGTVNETWRISDAASNTFAEAAFVGGHSYAVTRTASNRTDLLKDGVSVANASTASVSGVYGQDCFLGARNNAGTADSFFAGVFTEEWHTDAVTLSESAFESDLLTLDSGW